MSRTIIKSVIFSPLSQLFHLFRIEKVGFKVIFTFNSINCVKTVLPPKPQMQRQIIVSVFLWSPIWSRGDPQLEEDDPDDPDDSDDPDDLDDLDDPDDVMIRMIWMM